MRTLLGDTIDQVIVAADSAIIFVPEPGSRYHCRTNRFPGQAEYETVAIPEQILVNNEKDRFGQGMPVLVGMYTIEESLGIDLMPADHVPHNPHLIFCDRSLYTKNS